MRFVKLPQYSYYQDLPKGHFVSPMDSLTSTTQIKDSVRTLLTGAIDYAGLFPPAGLPMSEAVINYAMYRNSNYSWMLGRFVLSVAQLEGFIESADEFIARDGRGAPWRLSVLASEDIIETLHQVRDFNGRHAPGVVIDSIEVRANTISKIENTVASLPAGIEAYFELGLGSNFADLVAKLSETGHFAKIRTGGVVPEAFPGTRDVIRFVRTCAAANIPFKATAGLHHPIRCYRPLTYENKAPKGTMHGFLNLFMMVGFARESYRSVLLEDVMEDEFDEVFRFENQAASWRDDYRLTIGQIARLRKNGIHSFGSCSFDEPIADLQKLGIL